MSRDQSLNIQSIDTLDINPEGSNEFTFPAQDEQLLKQNKIRSIYQNLNFYNQHLKSKVETPDEAFRKTSSCVSSKAKYDYYYHNSEKKHEGLSRSQVIENKKSKRRQKVCKSAQIKKIAIPLQEQERLFNRVTIHCLKSKREEIQCISKQLQSQFSFVMKKIEKLKKHQFFEDLKEKKLQEIRQQSKKMSQELQKTHFQAESKSKGKKEELRRNVLAHRSFKKEIVSKRIEENVNSASHQRLLQKDYHERIQKSFEKEFHSKQKLFQKEKKQYKLRRSAITQKIQQKKEIAKKNFRNRWLNELEKVQQIKEEALLKDQKMKQKISNAIDSYNKLLNRQIRY